MPLTQVVLLAVYLTLGPGFPGTKPSKKTTLVTSLFISHILDFRLLDLNYLSLKLTFLLNLSASSKWHQFASDAMSGVLPALSSLKASIL